MSILRLMGIIFFLLLIASPLSAVQRKAPAQPDLPLLSAKDSTRLSKLNQRIEKRIAKRQQKIAKKSERSLKEPIAALTAGIGGVLKSGFGGYIALWSFSLSGSLGFLLIALLVVAGLLNIFALIFGIKGLKKNPDGKGMSTAGIVMGVIGFALIVLSFIIGIPYI